MANKDLCKDIYYSEKYYDDKYEYRYVFLMILSKQKQRSNLTSNHVDSC